jgi:hypothetical protein
MKKIILSVFVFVLVANAFNAAKAQSFQKGTNVLSLGVGLGSSLLSYSGSSQTPAISAQYERGIWDIGGPGVISLGGYVGDKSYKYSGKISGYSWSEKWNYTIVGVRSAYHYTGLDNEKFDVYGGIMLSANIVSYKYKNNSGYSNGYASAGNYNSGAGFTGFVGGRYYFSDHIAAMAELGYSVSYLTLGASFKF